MQDRGPSELDDGASSSYGRSADALLLLDPEKQQQADAARQVIEAIEAKTGRLCDGPSLVAEVHRLADRLPLASLLAGVAAAPDGYKPPYVVKYLRSIATGRITMLGAGGPDRETLLTRVKTLAGLIETYRSAGDDPPDELLVQLAECNNALESSEERA